MSGEVIGEWRDDGGFRCNAVHGKAPRDDQRPRAVRACRHEQVLRETLVDAIGVLEKTKRSFKSKQLELLRKKFIRVLIEEL